MKITAKQTVHFLAKDLVTGTVFRFPGGEEFFMKVAGDKYVDLAYGSVLLDLSPIALIIPVDAELVIHGDA